MSHAEVAERYARAIFELGTETGELSSLTDQIGQFARLFREHRQLRTVLEDPVIGDRERTQLLGELSSRIGLSPLAKNALSLLVRRRRLAALPEIADRLRALADEKNGVLRVAVTSAGPLSADYCSRLVARIEAKTGRRVLLQKTEDPSLIAGVVTRIGNHTIDGSVKGRLQQIEEQLLAHA